MSDEKRRALARLAGDGDLEAARHLVALLEREQDKPVHKLEIGRRTPFTFTNRGFALYNFLDRYGMKCSMQDSSIATEDCFWLGIDDPEPRILVRGKGWQDVPVPDNAFWVSRMHVNRRLARQLYTWIGRFLRHGTVTPRKERERGR